MISVSKAFGCIGKVAGDVCRLAGVRVIEDNGWFRVEASNGRQLIRVENERTTEPTGAVTTIYDPTSWVTAFKDVKTANTAVLNSTDHTLIHSQTTPRPPSKLEVHPDRYIPDFSCRYPTSEPVATVAVDAKLLSDLLLAAKPFTSGDNNAVILEIHADGLPIVIRNTKQAELRFSALLMPLRKDNI